VLKTHYKKNTTRAIIGFEVVYEKH